MQTGSLECRATNKLKPLQKESTPSAPVMTPQSVNQLSTAFKTLKLTMLLIQLPILDTQKGGVARLTANFSTCCQPAFLLCSEVFIKTTGLQKI